jgi:hypothetical protein
VRIADGDEWKTAGRTRGVSYEFQVIHYSLTNAPASFQRFMNQVFKDILDLCVVCYLDHILIYSYNPVERLKHVREVLRRLSFVQSAYTPKSRSALSAWTRQTSSVSLLALTAFEWTPRGSKSSLPFVVSASRECPLILGFRKRFIASYSDIIAPLTS